MPHSGNLPIRASKPRISIESRQGLLVWRFWTMGAVIWRPQKWQPCLSNRGIRGIWKNLRELFSMSFNSFEMLTWCVVCLFVPDDWKRAVQPNPQQKNRKESQNPTNNWNFEGEASIQHARRKYFLATIFLNYVWCQMFGPSIRFQRLEKLFPFFFGLPVIFRVRYIFWLDAAA